MTGHCYIYDISSCSTKRYGLHQAIIGAIYMQNNPIIDLRAGESRYDVRLSSLLTCEALES